MKRVLGFILLAILASACDGDLKGTSKPKLPEGSADVVVSRTGIPISNTHYNNDSSTDYLRCRQDHRQFYIDARKFVTGRNLSLGANMFTMFFPDPTRNSSVNAEWTSGSVQLYGKLPPYPSLGGNLGGKCQATLEFDEQKKILSGDITCHGFQNTDVDGIGTFDFSITNLSCEVQ